MIRLYALAPAKVNLCLFLGAVRSDGRHDLVTLFESVSLADELVLTRGADGDEVVCRGVVGPNLVASAFKALRARGWNAPAVRLEIRKQIPVAAGMGGGSADAAATLRMARELAPLSEVAIDELAASLGADVPSQLLPGVAVGTGAGEVVRRMEALPPHAFAILPQRFGLSSADVYAEADRLGLPRSHGDLQARLKALLEVLDSGAQLPDELLVNDLQPAALSLRPEIEAALHAARDAGADHAMVCGSGPTVIGLFQGAGADRRAAAAVRALSDRYAGSAVSVPVDAAFAIPQSA